MTGVRLIEKDELPAFCAFLEEDSLEDKNSFCLGFLADNYPAGALRGSIENGAVIIDRLFVDEMFRGSGIGGKLLQTALSAMDDEEINQAYILLPDERALSGDADRFLTRRGFIMEEETPFVSFTLKALFDGPLAPGKNEISESTPDLKQISEKELGLYNHLLISSEDAGYLPISTKNLAPESVFLKKDGALLGCLLLERLEDGLFCSFLHNGGDAADLSRMVIAAAKRCEKSYSPDTRIYASLANEKLADFLTRLTAGRLEYEMPSLRYALAT